MSLKKRFDVRVLLQLFFLVEQGTERGQLLPALSVIEPDAEKVLHADRALGLLAGKITENHFLQGEIDQGKPPPLVSAEGDKEFFVVGQQPMRHGVKGQIRR